MAPMPNPIAQRLRLLFNAGQPHPAGPGGVGQVASALDPAHRAQEAFAELNPANRVGQIAGGLGVPGAHAGGGGLHSLLAAAFAGGHGHHHGHGHGHGGGLAEQFVAQHNPAHMAEEAFAELGQDPGTHFGPDGGPSHYPPAPPSAGIHWFGPGGSGVAYPGEGGPVGSRGVSYTSPIRHRSALAQALQTFQQPPTHTYQAV